MGHLAGDAVGVLDHIHKTRGDGVPRHAVKLRALRRLDKDQAVLILDGTDAVGAVGARAGQNDRHGAVLVGRCQRPEEDVDRMIHLRVIIFLQAEYIRNNFNIVFRRNHVHMVPLDPHAVLCFQNRHHSVLSENVCQKTLVVRCQVLDDDEGHAGIAGQKSKQLLQRFKPAGRSADSYDTAGLHFPARGIFILHGISPSCENAEKIPAGQPRAGSRCEVWLLIILYFFL